MSAASAFWKKGRPRRLATLSAEQESLLAAVRDQWRTIGLATGPGDRRAAEIAAADVYRLLGLAPPQAWIWLGSPFAGLLGALILAGASPAGRGAKRLRGPLADRAGAVERDVLDQFRLPQRPAEPAGNGRSGEIAGRAGASVSERIRRLFYEEVAAQARSQVAIRLWWRVSDAVSDETVGRLREHVLDRLTAEIWKEVRPSLEAGLCADACAAGYGLHDAHWLAPYDFFRRATGLRGSAPIEAQMRLAGEAGAWWAFERVCILTERPVLLRRDAAGRLHAEDGPALLYPDGWALHVRHGVDHPARRI